MARILVVEDDGALRSDISDQLTSWGHDVQTARDGVEGFDAISAWQPDLVLSDINMGPSTIRVGSLRLLIDRRAA